MYEPLDPRDGEKWIQHPPIVVNGRDVYPPELLAAALANARPGEFAETWVTHDPIYVRGEDVYPPEMFAAARRGEFPFRSTDILMELVRTESGTLSADDMRALHDIAFRRLTGGEPAALELLRAVFQSAVSRVA